MSDKVKGSILLPWVKIIKANKSGIYDKYLTEDDKNVMNKRILPSSWYPFETYKNCTNAVVQVEAKGNMETCHQWGRAYCDGVMTTFYSQSIVKGKPEAAIKKFSFVVSTMFESGKLEVDHVSDGEIVVSCLGIDPHMEAWYYVMRGWIERFLELCMDKDVKSEFVSRSWKGDPNTKVKFTW